ncbi:hypothetical protein BKP35_17740 [Anaerobacillus arseniciselenatis]|uniref:Uncharacterized protein n=1 Tax=Anaerobacillus arseniciselenatis TaxID=85682 RepID=A0A1S2L7E6_9BACI|nr:hypothetical protein [Anaerobacillus arseniciselenatis]OIJ08301.1 hypothetical protein BKP35_17740 [Anaerobacillus arseniciselenatis]
MSLCPLCNGMASVETKCSTCHNQMNDQGRLLDYFDDYSAYLDIDGMKLFDGIENDAREQKCPHVFYCTNCDKENTILIQEI